jgi:hypothetical protein
MKALSVTYDDATDSVTPPADAQGEDWAEVCARFDGDVHRSRDAGEVAGYNALYVCYDEDNRPNHYLVAEDAELQRVRRRVFLSKLGR